MLLYKSHYLTVNLIEIRYLMHLQWTKPADLLDEVGLYAEVAKFLQNRIRRRGRLILWDFSVIEQRIDNKFLDWIFSGVLPHLISVKLKRVAFVIGPVFELPDGLASTGEREFEFRRFDNQQDAMQWLMEVADMKELGKSSHHHH